jgi:hypothetical protein
MTGDRERLDFGDDPDRASSRTRDRLWMAGRPVTCAVIVMQ